MRVKPHVLGLAGVSVVVGLALIVCSSLIIDLYKPFVEACNKYSSGGPACETIRLWIAAGSFGIIASVFQFASVALVFMDKTKLWSGLHIAICIICIAAFGIAVAKDGFHEYAGDKHKAFTSFALIDAIYSLIAAVAMSKL